MKKLIAMFLVAALALSLVACGGDNGTGNTNSDSGSEVESVVNNEEETGLKELPEEISDVEFDEDGEVFFFYNDIYPMGSQMLDNYRNGTISQETAETDAAALGFENVDSMLDYFDEVVEYLDAHAEDYQG